MRNLNSEHTPTHKEQTGGCQGWGVWGGTGEGGQKVQTSSYKISKSWGCNVQHGN